MTDYMMEAAISKKLGPSIPITRKVIKDALKSATKGHRNKAMFYLNSIEYVTFLLRELGENV